MQINRSDPARNDLREILAYVGSNFGRRRAEEALTDIRECAEMLKAFPKMGRIFVKDPELNITYRSLVAKS